MNPRKPIVVACVLLIILTGIFKNQLGLLYSIPIEWFFDLFNLDYQSALDRIGVLARDGKADYGIGILFYFPTYLGLHFVLIYFLFPNSPDLRKWLMIGLFLTTFSLGIITALSRLYDWQLIKAISSNLFTNLVGRPLVLFLVEGGGLLYEYVDQKLGE